MHRYLLLLLIGIIGLNACSKKGPSEPAIDHVNAALKAAFNYKIGTYWIYRDSLNGRVDSFFVTSNTDKYTDLPNGTGSLNSKESMDIRISEQKVGLPLADTQSWIFFYEVSMFCVNFTEKNTNMLIEYVPLINYPFQMQLHREGLLPQYTDSGIVNSINNAYSINGHTFFDVAIVTHSITATNITYNDCFYICPEAGLIKMRLNHPHDSLVRVWELQRWHIEQ